MKANLKVHFHHRSVIQISNGDNPQKIWQEIQSNSNCAAIYFQLCISWHMCSTDSIVTVTIYLQSQYYEGLHVLNFELISNCICVYSFHSVQPSIIKCVLNMHNQYIKKSLKYMEFLCKPEILNTELCRLTDEWEVGANGKIQ